MQKLPLYILFVCSNLFTYAQDISGQVIDVNNNPLVFAAVQNSDNTGVITNEEGYFSITLSKPSSMLVISCLGFKTKKVSYEDLEANGFVVVLDEQVNELQTVFLSTRSPDANEIIRKANENLSINYENEGINYRLFYRGTEYNEFKTLNFEIDKASGFKKKELTRVNLSLDSLTNTIKNNQSIEFTDYLADLMILNKETAKLDVVKATKLIDTKNSVSVDKIQDKAQRIFLTYLDTTKTYKLKTGMIKIEDSLSLNDSGNDRDTIEGLTYNTSTLKDLSHEHLNKSQNYDNSILTSLLDTELYDYGYLDATFYNGELVHMIAFEPRRSKAKFEGVLYITDESYAVIKTDYNYADGKRGQKLNLKLLLGVKFVENVKQGTIIYTKDGEHYHPKYIKEELGSYFYINRPIKFIENSTERKKVGFSFKIEGNNRTKNEILIVSQNNLDNGEFETFTELETTPYQKLDHYDPAIWSEYTSLEPLQEMKTFKADEN